MGGHLECIGWEISDKDEFARALDSVISAARDDAPGTPPYRHVRWVDPSGASIGFHLRDEMVECITPYFDPTGGLARWRVRTSEPRIDNTCEHCSGADCDVLDGDDLVTRATVQWLNFQPYRTWLQREQSFEIEIVAFSQQASFCQTREEFDAIQKASWSQPGKDEPRMPDGRPMRFAENAFLPEGMFGPDNAPVGQRATVLFAGRVESAETLTNTAAANQFRHVRIRTLPGSIDVVLAARETAAAPAVGQLALIRAWVVGRPVPPPPPPERRPWRLWR